MNKNTGSLFGFDIPFSAIVFGTSGGIGGAIAQQLYESMQLQQTTFVDSGQNRAAQAAHHLFGINRSSAPESGSGLTGLQADALDELRLNAAKETIQHSVTAHEYASVRLIVVGIGALHQMGQTDSASLRPEKTWRELSADNMANIFATNTIAPALIAKHFLPLLPHSGRSVFAVLSARVGSISDNRLGGWYSYRASKAALNQIIKTTSIELARTRPEAVCIGLHPGTVDTGLSKPFQSNVAEGKLFTPQSSANYLLNVIGGATPKQSGALLAWDGSIVPA